MVGKAKSHATMRVCRHASDRILFVQVFEQCRLLAVDGIGVVTVLVAILRGHCLRLLAAVLNTHQLAKLFGHLGATLSLKLQTRPNACRWFRCRGLRSL